ncbi:MAG: hypothetical protein NTY63_05280 [Candidatus Bipolaricaulota bacterium]|nr:hypothetical protein [Candidatus Bipolaricaulota bacterium]
MEYSPLLALATALFEVVVAVWALRGPGDRSIVRTAAAILVLLAGYQVTEVAICANVDAQGVLPRLAFLDVTWLPPLGLVLVAQLHRPRSRLFHAASRTLLAAAFGIAAWIALDRSFATASVCSAVYARYTHVMPRFAVYAGFYWIGLFGMVLFSGHGARTSADLHRRRLLTQVFLGTLGFVVPAVITSWFIPTARGALPSVMCHFALILAVFLARMIALERRQTGRAESPTPAREPA